MMHRYPKYFARFVLLFVWLTQFACGERDTKWKGQEPLQKVDTHTRPIQYQLKKTFDVGGTIHLSNEFDGARMNGVASTGEKEITVLITPENTPINSSPWYAFKIWSDHPEKIKLKITYNEGVSHRYYPKFSLDRQNWTPVDSADYSVDSTSIARGESPKFCEFDVSVSSDTLWISAQELIVSSDIADWSKNLAKKSFVTLSDIGESTEGRKLELLEIGRPESKKLIMVLSRQHPSEVTGWLAMKAFVERMCSSDSLAETFRNEYTTYVIPCVNPDGVDLGHWRHSAAGIDLNRDWEAFNQPETQAIRKFMQDKVLKGKQFIFAIDFHSTFEDIYYTISPELKGNMPGLVPEVIQAMAGEIPGYDPNIRPNEKDAVSINSTVSIFHAFHAEALTYEVGDNTPREQLEQKGVLTAENLMKRLLEE